MKTYKLTIVISDEYADEDTSSLTSAVSNLEYDGYTIHSIDLEELK